MRRPGRTGSSRPTSCPRHRLPRWRRAHPRPLRPARRRDRGRRGRWSPPRPRDGSRRRTSHASERGRARRARCCASVSTRPRTTCPPGFSRDLAGLERFAALRAGGRRAPRRGREAEPCLLRGIRVARAGRPGAPSREPAHRPAGHRRREAGRHRVHRRAASRRVVRPARGRCDHRQPVSRGRGGRAAARAPRPVRIRALPDIQSGRRRAPGPCRRQRRPPKVGRRSGCTSAWRAWRPAGGRAGRSGSWWGPRHPMSSRGSVPSYPGLAFLVPGVGAQGGAIDPVLQHGPATEAVLGLAAGRWTARERVEGHRGRCRQGRSGGPIRACRSGRR